MPLGKLEIAIGFEIESHFAKDCTIPISIAIAIPIRWFPPQSSVICPPSSVLSNHSLTKRIGDLGKETLHRIRVTFLHDVVVDQVPVGVFDHLPAVDETDVVDGGAAML